jgi:hypothetical protein
MIKYPLQNVKSKKENKNEEREELLFQFDEDLQKILEEEEKNKKKTTTENQELSTEFKYNPDFETFVNKKKKKKRNLCFNQHPNLSINSFVIVKNVISEEKENIIELTLNKHVF